MNRLLVGTLVACCIAYAPSAFADGTDVPGGPGSTGNEGKGNQGCWTIPIQEALTEEEDYIYKNPGDMFLNEKSGKGRYKDDNTGLNPKQLAVLYSDYFKNVGDMIDQQCGADAVTPS